ncbi:MAG: hypothetical protein WCL43_03915 [Chlorobium sp.]|nr:MAG: hypothetical protein FDX12_08920 [Chlorobium sp.]
MATLKKIILDVENQIGGPHWSNWDGAQDIIDVYAPYGVSLEGNAVNERFVLSVLERAIESNGKTLPSDCQLYDHMILDNLVSSNGNSYWLDMLHEKYH